MPIKREIQATKDGLIEHLREKAADHKEAGKRAPTQRRAAHERGLAEGLEMAAAILADTTFVADESADGDNDD